MEEVDWYFSRERLAKGSGCEGNYGRVEVASPGDGCRKNREKPRQIRGIDIPVRLSTKSAPETILSTSNRCFYLININILKQNVNIYLVNIDMLKHNFNFT